jgi:RND family efflux transporter MFP subunit
MRNAFINRILQSLVCLGCMGNQLAWAQFASSMSQRDLDGVIHPYADSEVASAETGVVRKIFVQPGDRVVRGQPLAELDSETVQAQLEVKRIESEAVGKIDQAKAEVELYTTKLQKLSAMFLDGKASQSELERAKVDLQVARGRLRSEEENVRVLLSDVERFEKQLAERTITAPIDGIVIDLLKEIGEIVAANSPAIVRIIDASRLRATFSVQESELPTLKVGKSVRIQMTNGQTVIGKIEYIPPVADPETGWFMINVLIENHDGKIVGSRCTRLPNE